jgi:hypothetical protein
LSALEKVSDTPRPSESSAGREPVVVPTSIAEDGVWFLHHLADDVPVYSVPLLMHLQGSVDVRALGHAFRRVAERQESLRAGYLEHEGRPVKVIHPDPFEYLEVLDGGTRPTIDELVRRPFDLTRPPLLRAYLIPAGEERWDLLFNVHHIVFDDWSLKVLIEELGATYRETVLGTPAELPELQVNYIDYAAWQRRWLDGEEAARERDHWRRRLENIPPPLDLSARRGGDAPTFTGSQCAFTIDWNLFQAVRDASHELGVTTFAFLLANFHLTLWLHSDSDEFLVGTFVANRPTQDLEHLLGFFVNTVSMRFPVFPEDSVAHHVRAAQDAAREALAHGQLPIQDVVRSVGAPRRGGATPLANVGFTLRSALPPLDIPDVAAEVLPLHNGTSLFDLILFVEERQQGGIGTIEFSRAFDPAFIDRFAADYLRILAATSATPNIDVASLKARLEDEPASDL